MITPSKQLRSYIKGFETLQAFCKRYDVEYPTLKKYLDETQTCSARFIENVKVKGGFDFERAFDIKRKG